MTSGVCVALVAVSSMAELSLQVGRGEGDNRPVCQLPETDGLHEQSGRHEDPCELVSCNGLCTVLVLSL